MRGKYSNILRKLIFPLITILLVTTLFCITCDARGSGGGSSSYSSGYSSGSYSSSSSSNSSGDSSDSGEDDTSPLQDVVVYSMIIGGIFLCVFIKVIIDKLKSGYQLKKDRIKYKELYPKLIMGIDDVEDFIEKAYLDKRRCVNLLPVLSKYIELLENSNNSKKSVMEYRIEHDKELFKLEDCATCKCLKCMKDCKMLSCVRCEPGYHCKIASCDNNKAAVYLFEDKMVTLSNNFTGSEGNYKVLSVIEDLEYKQLYIIVKGYGEGIVLYYYPGIDKDDYGEIKDSEDIEFAIKAYEDIYKNKLKTEDLPQCH